MKVKVKDLKVGDLIDLIKKSDIFAYLSNRSEEEII